MLSALAEHEDLVEASGARHLVRKTGWIKLFRTAQKRDHEFSAAESLKSSFGTVFERLDAGQLQLQEPDVRPDFIGGLHWNEPWCVSDPAALVGAYVRYFEELGGNFVRGDAMSLEERKSSWRFKSTEGKIEAKEAVVALGPWSSDLTTRLGYRFPIGVKRGYHMHYSLKNGSVLNNCMVDAERGYLLAPMARGLRLTTGVEFALRDAPSTPIQLERAEKIARQSFPLANRVDQHAWLGSRPCTTDMLPILGRAPRHDRLWFAFGHGHHGLTNGPLTGRLMAQLITREDPLIDPVPYSPLRFRN
jgi:D-amino-acid dehydrogenase